MSQKEKARAIVEESFEFEAPTRLSADEIVAAAQRAAAGSRKMGVGIVESEVKKNDAGALSAGYLLKGPGGLVSIMAIVISGKPEGDGRTLVRLKVGDFLFKKGSLGAKPTINGHKVVAKFVSILKTELAAG
jgi:hypothetical protein